MISIWEILDLIINWCSFQNLQIHEIILKSTIQRMNNDLFFNV